MSAQLGVVALLGLQRPEQRGQPQWPIRPHLCDGGATTAAETARWRRSVPESTRAALDDASAVKFARLASLFAVAANVAFETCFCCNVDFLFICRAQSVVSRKRSIRTLAN